MKLEMKSYYVSIFFLPLTLSLYLLPVSANAFSFGELLSDVGEGLETVAESVTETFDYITTDCQSMDDFKRIHIDKRDKLTSELKNEKEQSELLVGSKKTVSLQKIQVIESNLTVLNKKIGFIGGTSPSCTKDTELLLEDFINNKKCAPATKELIVLYDKCQLTKKSQKHQQLRVKS